MHTRDTHAHACVLRVRICVRYNMRDIDMTNNNAQRDIDALITRANPHIDVTIVTPTRDIDDLTDHDIDTINASGAHPYHACIDAVTVDGRDIDTLPAFDIDTHHIFADDIHTVLPFWTDGKYVCAIMMYKHPDA